jgi:hypothetical protein
MPLLPRRPDYVFRQSYYVFLFLPFIIGGYHIWAAVLPGVIRFAKRFGVVFLVGLPVIDLITAYFFGTWQDGYTRFLYTGQASFFYFIIFSFYVILTGKRILPIISMTATLLACRLSHYGDLFNSLSSLLMFVILVILSMSRTIGNSRAARLVTALVPLALIAMTVEISIPSLCRDQEKDVSIVFSHPGNTYFRCEAWRNNMADLYRSYLVGVGYGVPYFPFTFEGALVAKNFADEMHIPVSAPATDVLYIRGQHSSLINTFYRLGIAGGAVFLLMNWALLIGLARASASDSLLGRLSLISCGLTVLAFFQISANVGLESPRYLINYTLAVSLALVCLEAVQLGGQRPHPSAGYWRRKFAAHRQTT